MSEQRLILTGRRILAAHQGLLRMPQPPRLPVGFSSLLTDPVELMDEAISAMSYPHPSATIEQDESGQAWPPPQQVNPGNGMPEANSPHTPTPRAGITSAARPALSANEDGKRALRVVSENSGRLIWGRLRYALGEGAGGAAPKGEDLPTLRPFQPGSRESPHDQTQGPRVSDIPLAPGPPILAGHRSRATSSSARRSQREARRSEPTALPRRDSSVDSESPIMIVRRAEPVRSAASRDDETREVEARALTARKGAGWLPVAPSLPQFSRHRDEVAGVPATARGDETHASATPTRLTRNASRLTALLTTNLETAALPSQAPLASAYPPATGSIADRVGGLTAPGSTTTAESAISVPSIDAILEELYQRLRVEFLRAYGTSGGD